MPSRPRTPKSPARQPPAAPRRTANPRLAGQRRAQLASHYRARFRAGGGR